MSVLSLMVFGKKGPAADKALAGESPGGKRVADQGPFLEGAKMNGLKLRALYDKAHRVGLKAGKVHQEHVVVEVSIAFHGSPMPRHFGSAMREKKAYAGAFVSFLKKAGAL